MYTFLEFSCLCQKLTKTCRQKKKGNEFNVLYMQNTQTIFNLKQL